MMPMTRNSEPSDPEGPRIALRCRGIVHRTRRASSTFYLMLRSHGRSKSERPCEVWPPCPEAMQEPHENTEYSKNMPKQQLAQKVPVKMGEIGPVCLQTTSNNDNPSDDNRHLAVFRSAAPLSLHLAGRLTCSDAISAFSRAKTWCFTVSHQII